MKIITVLSLVSSKIKPVTIVALTTAGYSSGSEWIGSSPSRGVAVDIEFEVPRQYRSALVL